MATPQRPLPEEPRRPELEVVQRRTVERQISPRWRFGFWWIWMLVIVAIWFVGFGLGDSGDWIRGNHGLAAANGSGMIGPGVATLEALNKQNYVGQAFNIRNAAVDRPASPHAVWIGSASNSEPMLLVLPGAATSNFVPSNGDLVDAAGEIYRAPTAAQAQRQWGLNQADAQHVAAQGAYILGTRVQMALPGSEAVR